MVALLTVLAVLLDAVLGEPRRWHPLVGFGRWALYFEQRLNARAQEHPQQPREGSTGGALAQPSLAQAEPPSHALVEPRPLALKVRGVLAVIVAVVPWVLVVALATEVPGLQYLVAVASLYFALGHQSLKEHALRVYRALQAGDLDGARSNVGLMVSRDTGKMDTRSIALATVESVLENGNDAVFGALFWFLVAGAPGALLYRLANTLDAMWGYRTPRYLHFGWAAARLDDVLNFIPARLTALTYALVGSTRTALRCWCLQASAWDSPNAGPVMASGAGALDLGLGGGAYYHGHWEDRPPLGIGPPPDASSIPAALRLVRTGVVLWLLAVIAVEVVAHA
jgi:adenosylcobinamide-phosphate synthase